MKESEYLTCVFKVCMCLKLKNMLCVYMISKGLWLCLCDDYLCWIMSWNIACNVVLWFENKWFDGFEIMFQGLNEKHPFWLLRNAGILFKQKQFCTLSCLECFLDYPVLQLMLCMNGRTWPNPVHVTAGPCSWARVRDEPALGLVVELVAHGTFWQVYHDIAYLMPWLVWWGMNVCGVLRA